MKRRCFPVLIACLMALLPCAVASEEAPVSRELEMVVWERQNWESNGGYQRLTIWRDGHSQVEVSPRAIWTVSQMNIKPKSGWTAIRQERHIVFVRRDIYPPGVARMKLQQVLEAGIQFLETFRPGYRDGSGTRVVVQIDGKLKETVIPMFMDADRGSANHKRFLAVSKILDGFDTDAYQMPGKE